MTLTTLLLLTAVMAALAAVPSVSVSLVVLRAATGGFVGGAAVALGVVIGDLIFVLLALTGMAAIAELLGSLFVGVKILAAIYLIYLGLRLLHKPLMQPVTTAPRVSGSGFCGGVAAGLLVTLGDIKAILFYASLFPAVVDVGQIGAVEISLIVIVTVVAVGGVKLAYAATARHLVGRWLRSGRQRPLERAAGLGMVGAGGYLLVRH
ncbi:LysE family translocator [Spongiibacter taiwanensis]|uniref:LysE family translocator n=1 Tax=Spongiibacter taiwanensis TaxID=1748242 RepID=UPI002035E9B4|nr:LysE family translocator [Spongiibacter taiwanensis]USA41581.1 LysE family translocator [Spongiibacter taiwanensis]